MGKYFKKKFARKEEIYNFIQSCQYELEDGSIGFKKYPTSPKKYPNIWSTYHALVSMKILGVLKEYLESKGKSRIQSEIKRFLISHQKKNIFIHCKNKDCEICGEYAPEKTLYFLIEIFSLLKTDIRIQQSKFLNFISKTTEDYSVIFKLLCLNYLGLNSKVKIEDLKYLNEHQKNDGGFNFSEDRSSINETFWTVYTLHTYSWFFDYNPAGIYSFINSNLTKILKNKENWSPKRIKDISKLIIVLSLIWEKFIDEIERAIFKELENKTFLNLDKITCLFGLSDVMEDIISYINLNYVFNLRILDNEHKFHNFVKGLNAKEQIIAKDVYNSLKENSVISISEIVSDHKSKFPVEDLKVKNVIELIDEMEKENFFKGKIRTKRKLIIKKKYYFYLDTFIEKLIISDTKINLERLEEEKEKLKEIENDIYNMRLKLKKTSNQIKEEVKSYLILNEIDLAKQRLRFILRDALMNADFLNENIENNFNVDLYYINIRARLSAEIDKWEKEYSRLKQKLKNIDQDLQVEISEKEELRTLNFKLEKLDEKIFQTGNYYNKRINDFRKYLRETLQDGYTEDKFSLIKREFTSIKESVENFDEKILKFSKNISTDEDVILKKHKEVINNWISIKEEMQEVFDYYEHGFKFFEEYLEKLERIKEKINTDIKNIENKISDSIEEKQFEEAFEIIKEKSDEQLKEKSKEIKIIQKAVKKELKKNQKLFLLYRHLQKKSDQIEENLIDLIEEPVSKLRSKVIKKRNKVKIRKFEDFIAENVSDYRNKIQKYKADLNEPQRINQLEISDIEDDLEDLRSDFQDLDEKFEDKLEEGKELVDNFDEKLKVSIIKWEKFKEFFYSELDNIRDEFINSIISANIINLINKEKTNNILIKDLKKKVDLKCKVLLKRIKDMIDISKLEGKLYEKEKCLLVYTDQY
ncbi:MAG: prenyltransferase/squalene oxidase repeat-containing protein, partial [archaeon]